MPACCAVLAVLTRAMPPRPAAFGPTPHPLLPAGALMVNDEQLLQGFRRCKELGAVPQVGMHGGWAAGWFISALRLVKLS